MSKIPLASIRPTHQDVEFLTDDEDDFEPKPTVSKFNHNKLEDSRSKFQTILKLGKRKGDFNWNSGKSVLSKGIKRKNEKEGGSNVIEITDDESEDISPKKENVLPESSAQYHTSPIKIEAPKEVLIHHRLMISSVSVDFPVRPYPCQTAVMSMLIKGCTNKQNCLLESPTGSGKTLALLCSSLAWQDNYARFD
ncbi:uncharacterized protein LOC117170097 isoform X2 [Belonocnema kinseyi]|nr:uncharacterized protein LOC117170097 isoform X2 [Belonocnema kinseyi]